jgi:hypothetical protein
MQLTAGRRARTLVVGLLALAGLIASGCGSQSDYKNDLRPAAPINVTAEISDRGVSVSPTRFGAGPIVLIVTNQSTSSQAVTLEDEQDVSGKGLTQSIPAINPGDTGQIKADVTEGTYRVRVGNEAIPSATLFVGTKRRSAQNDVLQP